MKKTISLNGVWSLTYAEGVMNSYAEEFSQLAPQEGRLLLEAEVPAPIHRVLENHGIIDDPNYGINTLKARWVEECLWIYRRTFSVPAEAVTGTVHLIFDRLEMVGRILINGKEAGRACNALYPARIDISGKLKEGENTIVVIIESGIFEYADRSGKYSASDFPDMAWMTKRNWLRKAQNQSGWDWHPRLQNVGILGDVRVEYSPDILCGLVSLAAVPADDLASAEIRVAADAFCPEGRGGRRTMKVTVEETGFSFEKEFDITPGKNLCELSFVLDAPELWWPAGCGRQYLYTAKISFAGAEEVRRFGVRKVTVDKSPHPEKGNYFIVNVNDRPVFCKGGNYIPADIYYSEVDGKRYAELVDIARQANFNMLRIWGGGIYMTREFCEACDEAGIMVWHDFIYACCTYPGDDPDFLANALAEAEYIVRWLDNHPSMAVWCGNNELEMGAPGLAEMKDREIFHTYLKDITGRFAPQVFYWPSSPYSEEGDPNDPSTGDQHPWTAALELPGGTDFWHYRTRYDRFPNEGGILGASTIPTLKQFLPEKERFVRSFTWDHHDNTFARRDTQWEKLGHAYTTVSLWTGLDALKLSLEDYAVVSGLLQAEGLEEYIYNYRRRMYSSASAIFWMFNDSWPTVNGWTIIDYYLRKKLSFHPVRRAFAEKAVAVVREEKDIVIYGVNDSDCEWQGTLRWGIFNTRGGLAADSTIPAVLPGNASVELTRFPVSMWEDAGTRRSGVFAQLLDCGGQETAVGRLFTERFKDIDMNSDPAVRISCANGMLRLEAEEFVWKCCLDIEGEKDIPDNAFDIFPGIPKIIPWEGDLPEMITCGNRFRTPSA